MKKVLLAVALLAFTGSVAMAGPNAGGHLLLSLADGVVYTSDNTGYCGVYDPGTCDNIIAEGQNGPTYVLNVVAAFGVGSSPRMKGVTFGWTYGNITLVELGSCGDFEISTTNWPASGEGTAVTWDVAQTNLLNDVYWVATYSYYAAPQSLCLVEHPTQGGNFGDDSVPPELDAIVAFGCFGFNTPGEAPCPPDQGVMGACCFQDGSCVMAQGEQDCIDQGGDYQGDGTFCDPNPCPPPPVTGACCVGEECTITTEADCPGEYQGDDTVCDPNPCIEPVPTIESSWGQIKSIYR